VNVDKCLPPRHRELECGCYGVGSSNNRRIQVLACAVGRDQSSGIEDVRDDRSVLGGYKGPCYGGGPI